MAIHCSHPDVREAIESCYPTVQVYITRRALMMLVRMGGTFYWNTFWQLLRKISHNESLELTSYHCHRGVIRHRWITFTAQWRDEHTLIIDRPLSGLDRSMVINEQETSER